MRVFGNTTDTENARKILGSEGFYYLTTGFESIGRGDLVVGGKGAVGGVPFDVESRGAVRIAGVDRADTLSQILFFGISNLVRRALS